MLNVIKLSIGVPGQSYSRIRGVWKGLQGRNPRGQFLEQKHMISPSFRWDQIIKCRRYEIGDNMLLLKTGLDVQRTHLCDLYFKSFTIVVTVRS